MNRIQFSLPVIVIKEANNFVAYSPALDLSTVGKTFDKAKAILKKQLIFFLKKLSSKRQ